MTAPELTSWVVEPIDPLVFGDGRSIGTTLVAGSRTLPPPSQLAGTVRSQAGSDAEGNWNRANLAAVLAHRVLGPIGVELDAAGDIVDWWLPRPADALPVAERGALPAAVLQLVPKALPPGCAWGPHDGLGVAPVAPDRRKPDGRAARLWGWHRGVLPWLLGSAPEPGHGIDGPALEPRTHVAIGPTDTVRDGALFGVTGVRYTTAAVERDADPHPWGAPPKRQRRYAIAFRTDARLSDVVHPLGGERRLARWRRVPDRWPALPDEVLRAAEAGSVRLILATPARFRAGSTPDPAVLFHGIDGEVVTAVSDRPEVVSGWDLAERRPKPTRRLVPAGATLFLRLGGDRAARRAWAERTWLAPISDDEPSRRDGYGLALLGTWDGACPELDLGGQP